MRRTLVALLLAATARAEPRLTVRVVDEKQNVLDTVKCGLVRGKGNGVYARFEGGLYEGKHAIAQGDVLYVYRRGFDLRRLLLDGKATAVDVILKPSSQIATLRLKGAGPDTKWWMDVVIEVDGAWPKPPVEDAYRVRMKGPMHKVAFAAGTRCGGYVFGTGGLVWPMTAHLKHAKESVLHWEPSRVIPVETEGSVELAAAQFLPDLLVTPAGPPKRIDAMRWALNSPWWLSDQFEQNRGQHRRLKIAPDIAFHVFARGRRTVFYRYVSRGASSLDLRRPSQTRLLDQIPILDGKPVQPGTLLAAGRLDIIAISKLRQVRLKGCFAVTGKQWEPVTLPAADWLTSWHVDSGLAHYRWSPERHPKATSYAGVILFTGGEGRTLSGVASVFHAWKGSGRIRTAPAAAHLQKRVENTRAIRFHGLPHGGYGVSFELVVRDADGKIVARLDKVANVFLRKESPTAKVMVEAK